MSTIIVLAFWCAIVPAMLWVWNMLIYREPSAASCGDTGTCLLSEGGLCTHPCSQRGTRDRSIN